jgi:phthalate 4,5-cis-dihydrodiol dehydrogenase
MSNVLHLGVVGLGRAFTLMLPTFLGHPRIALAAASDPRPDALARFSAEFAAPSYPTVEALCRDPRVQAVYIASPHQFHLEHVAIAAEHGKHVLVEKPMALSVQDCLDMIAVAKRNRIHLLVGHSHSYDLPYLRARELIASGEFGSVRMITALNYTDFLFRPRRPEELDTRAGGGVVFSQAAHQVDIVRLLAGAPAKTLRAFTGSWDVGRPTEGAYTAQMSFANGTFASLTYSGYAHFDSDEFSDWWGELGQRRDPEVYGAARHTLRTARNSSEEIELKNRRAYGPSGREVFRVGEVRHNHFGLIVVSCERADLRPTPRGILIYADDERRMDELEPPIVPRAEVVDELHAAVLLNRTPLHAGEWGLATLECCRGILESAASAREVSLVHQV